VLSGRFLDSIFPDWIFKNARTLDLRTEESVAGFCVNQPETQETRMSGVNGDKARFNRRRRAKISRRQSNEKMLKALAEKNLVAPAKPANLKEKVA
jgi:hypothetical protein